MLGTSKASLDAVLVRSSPQTAAHQTAGPARKRPLRTYGRRVIATTQDTQLETSVQKNQEVPSLEQSIGSPLLEPEVDSDTIVVATDDTESPSPSPSPQQCESSKSSQNSILSYFKPVSRAVPEIAKDSDIIDAESSSPPPSPRQAAIPRKRRRLTTRPEISCRQDSLLAERSRCREETRLVPEEQSDAPLIGKKRKLQDISPKSAHGAPFIAVTTPPDILLQRSILSNNNDGGEHNHHQNPLREISGGVLNQMDNHNEEGTGENDVNKNDVSAGSWTQRMTKKKKKQKDLVQTTLTLAINPGPGFTICKDCGILYNHLNEHDRKEHKRRHAAHVRDKVKGKT